jgi:DNA-binding transcriptional MerR regulator
MSMSEFMKYESQEFVDLLDLQGTTELVTKSELLDKLRERDSGISARTLTYYMTEGLVPKAVRVGERAGAYPDLVVDMTDWVTSSRDIGLSIDAIKELLPVWKYLYLTSVRREIDLRMLEGLIERNVHSHEATHAVPSLLAWWVCPHCLRKSVLINKNGDVVSLADSEQQVIHFVHGQVGDEQGGVASIPLPTIPRERLVDDPNAIVMSVTDRSRGAATHGHGEDEEREVSIA